ncbi:MAG: glycosyltransferase family 2 protein [bacterium]|nr:MAG: glycosyltransferase family 2 protein [bacterium]
MAMRYVLITTARNEEQYLEETIHSVIRQTVLPLRWVIVSDGSTDRTEEIVAKYLPDHPWMDLLALPGRAERSFSGKADAFNRGLGRIDSLDYEYIGNLDADVSFGEDYFAYLLGELDRDPELGVAGTDYVEGDFHSFRDSYISENHVNGQIQMFRRACFDQIGGYLAIPYGGIDWVAVTTARMKGWKTRSFSDRVFNHLRRMGTEGTNVLGARFHYGKKDYFLGGHPLWQIFRSTFQMTKKPYVLGGTLLLAGYLWASATMEKQVPEDLERFHRGEQMKRLRGIFTGTGNRNG